MRTPADLRAAYQQLANAAPAAAQLQLDLTTAHQRRRRTLISVAAIAVAAVGAAILVTVGITNDRHNSQPAGTVVTCTSPTHDASAAAKDISVIRSRMSALGIRGTVRSTSGGSAVLIIPSDRAQLDANTLCGNATFQARAVVDASHGCAAGKTSAPSEFCAPDDIRLSVGSTIFDDRQIASAEALPPNPSAGPFAWTVMFRLTPTGQQAWSAYTTAHHFDGATQITDIAACGMRLTPPGCADYVAFIANGRVISVPLTLAPITGGTTQVAGGGTNGFTEASAHQLAATLTHLPVPLVVTTH